MRQTKDWISLLILVVIALQAAVLFPRKLQQEDTLWPFLTWTMYAQSSLPGPIYVDRWYITSITQQGTRLPVSYASVGLSLFAFEGIYVRPMKEGNSSAAQHLLSCLNANRSDPIVKLDLTIMRYMMTNTGIAKKVVSKTIYRIESPDSRQ